LFAAAAAAVAAAFFKSTKTTGPRKNNKNCIHGQPHRVEAQLVLLLFSLHGPKKYGPNETVTSLGLGPPTKRMCVMIPLLFNQQEKQKNLSQKKSSTMVNG
jgi:hypothetical protein